MDILVGYGIGPRAERILRFYWENLSMVARAGLYYGALFKGHWGSPMEIPSPPPYLHGDGRSDSSLGHAGRRRGCRNRSFQTGDPMAGSVI